MSAAVLLASADTEKLSARAISAVAPSRVLTVRVLPSSFSTVPRMRVGVVAGGVCASAGITKRAATAAAMADFRIILASPFDWCATGGTAAPICPARRHGAPIEWIVYPSTQQSRLG